MRKQVFAVGSVVMLLMSASAAVAADPPRHWLRQANPPVVVTIHDDTRDALWQNALRVAAQEWNAGITNVQFLYTIASGDCEDGAGPLTVVVCIHANSQPDYLAEARWRPENGHLAQMVIWMGPRSDPDRARLSCHELGHALGLEHRTEKKTRSCMAPGGPGTHPDRADFQNVTAAHAHVHP
jgi:hypothetical protein